MRILFISPYPTGEAPSQRFRFEQYFSVLEKKGYKYTTSPFLSRHAWKIVYKQGYFLQKVWAIIVGYLRRVFDLLRVFRYDVVFIHRESSPFGVPWFEWIITRLFRKYTIYDFDDAIWIPNASETNKNLTMMLKRFGNTAKICSWANVVSVGNAYLADYALRYNKNVVINPTTIDTSEYHNTLATHQNDKFVIGWTGSHSTVQYLDELFPIFKRLEAKYDFEVHVICDVPPKFELQSLKFVPWNKQGEIGDLLNFNVGLMPLREDIWAKGKCGFKALQYMALGIPAIVSGVGVNAEIVDNEINGFVCRTPEDWYATLEKLLSNPSILKKLSENTRQKIVDNYSLSSNKENFLRLFEKRKIAPAPEPVHS
jgi:glycosyltransferase involved in cell wall biosynthesis